MTASVVLTSLPRDATAALKDAGAFDKPKVTVRFKDFGSAPILKQPVCRINATQRFEAVVAYLRRVVKCGPQDSVFLYVNNTFAPSLDEIVGNLHRVSRVHCLEAWGYLKQTNSGLHGANGISVLSESNG
ncbi:hypothetical protein VE04_05359 [Pseudogymnoascus sp. 24MN13]|nr:hypothetical protein VE04_05359 [Pseudogymnoascus sp. 24MN13]